MGWFLRALHNWGATAMVVMVIVHMTQVFLFGAFKYPRELTWVVGVFLLLLTLGMAFTGQVLRWDGDAYWGIGVGAHVVIGVECRVLAQVALRDATQLGDRVVIHSGTVIGADGFGYVRDGARHVKIPQVGRVVVEDDVEIGANVAIDRATFGETRIGRGTKIDNLVQVAHNVAVGPDAILVAQVGIAGSTTRPDRRSEIRIVRMR
jgi:acetyltransferase-like isoleucine patch superfamily enzyme